MRICVDENIPLVTVNELEARGHDVLDIRGTAHQGISDDLLWRMAQDQGRLFITTDKGFVEHRNESHHGLIVVRLRQPNEMKIHERVMYAFENIETEQWSGVTIVMKDAVQSVWRGQI